MVDSLQKSPLSKIKFLRIIHHNLCWLWISWCSLKQNFLISPFKRLTWLLKLKKLACMHKFTRKPNVNRSGKLNIISRSPWIYVHNSSTGAHKIPRTRTDRISCQSWWKVYPHYQYPNKAYCMNSFSNYHCTTLSQSYWAHLIYLKQVKKTRK